MVVVADLDDTLNLDLHEIGNNLRGLRLTPVREATQIREQRNDILSRAGKRAVARRQSESSALCIHEA
jgi:hypothetical protein